MVSKQSGDQKTDATRWRLRDVDGNPFNGQSVKLTGNQPNCAAVTSVDGSTKACSNSNDFTLTLC
jgi:hypothetical protein